MKQTRTILYKRSSATTSAYLKKGQYDQSKEAIINPSIKKLWHLLGVAVLILKISPLYKVNQINPKDIKKIKTRFVFSFYLE